MSDGTTSEIDGLAERIAAVRTAVAAATERAGRTADSVTIVAVSKTVGRATVDEAHALGMRHFGENRVQDARDKFAATMPEGTVLHMIGQLQTNKAVQAARLFDVIQSVDRPSLIDELERQGARLDRRLTILLEVGVAGEEQKAGCDPAAAAELVARIETCAHLHLTGLMTMAPLTAGMESARPVFRGLRELRDALVAADSRRTLPILSMGMTNDFPVAIEEGATHVRIGRAIFGG